MKNVQKGFTLIELMIVVAIIAILAAIAIPQYQNYVAKAQFSESQTVADGMKTSVAEYYTQAGKCPGINGTNGFPAAPGSYSGKYVASADVKAGAGAGAMCNIEVTFKVAGSVAKPLDKKVVTFAGVDNGGTFAWKCSATGIAAQYLPAACQS